MNEGISATWRVSEAIALEAYDATLSLKYQSQEDIRQQKRAKA